MRASKGKERTIKARFKKFSQTKRANKLLAILIVLAVVGIGVYLIVVHASPPYGSVAATSGTLAGNASVASDPNATNGHYVQFDTTTTTTGGPPALPTGSQSVNGITFSPSYTTSFKGSSTSPPTNTYWFQSNDPGASDNSFWPGNLAAIDNGILTITTEEESGEVASGGIGASSSIAQTPPAMVDWTQEFGGNVQSLVRYMLWWPSGGNWPANQEFDMLEGNPASPTQFHMTWHGNNPSNGSTNVTVGHLPESGIDNLNQWYAFRSIWVAGSSGYLELLAGPNFNSLTEVDEITAAQISSAEGGAQIDTTPHVPDWAVEGEGPISSSQITPPIVDSIGGFQLYK